MLDQDYVWEALYCECIYESGYFTLSVHRTEAGAKKQIKEHKANLKAEYEELYKGDTHLNEYSYAEMKAWKTNKIEVKD